MSTNFSNIAVTGASVNARQAGVVRSRAGHEAGDLDAAGLLHGDVLAGEVLGAPAAWRVDGHRPRKRPVISYPLVTGVQLPSRCWS